MRAHWIDAVTADRLRLLDEVINTYFTLTGDPDSRLKEIEERFEFDMFRLKVRLEQVYEKFTQTGKLPFNPDLDISEEDFRGFRVVTNYQLHTSFIIGPPRDEEERFDWFIASPPNGNDNP